uniref:Uncharacterized protein n=1 Tax=Neolamprologus brichardi TaxID=32507 RepID=A0A3Q4G9R2_NEOBR
MELSAIGEQVFAVESIVKKRVRKVSVLSSSQHWRHAFFNFSFGEPECYFKDANESSRLFRAAFGATSENIWRPVICPGEITVTDITLNSLTVTFRESRVAKGFFRDWGLKV